MNNLIIFILISLFISLRIPKIKTNEFTVIDNLNISTRIMRFLTPLCIILCGILSAQEAIVPAGGDISGTGGTVSFSIGQVVYTSISGSQGFVLQGVQQPYEISEILDTFSNKYDLVLSISPNPTSTFIVLKTTNPLSRNLSYELYNLQAKIIQNASIISDYTTILMSALPSAIYILKVSDEQQNSRIFRIIKN